MKFKGNSGVCVKLLVFTLAVVLVCAPMTTLPFAGENEFSLREESSDTFGALQMGEWRDNTENNDMNDIWALPMEGNITAGEPFTLLAPADQADASAGRLRALAGPGEVVVEFNLMGSADEKPADRIVTVGEPYGPLPDYTAYTRLSGNYVPAGWYTYDELTGDVDYITSDSIVKIDRDHQILLNWEFRKHNVIFYPGGGSWAFGSSPNDPITVTVETGRLVSVPGAPVMPGWEFEGWQEPSGVPFDPAAIPVTRDMELVPIWRQIEQEEDKEITVAFDLNGGFGDVPSSITVKYGDEYGALPDYSGVTRPGYAAMGWYPDASGTGAAVTYNSIVNTDQGHVLYLKWEKTGVTVTVNPDGGVWADGVNPAEPRQTISEIGGSFFIHDGVLVRSGYVQDGWIDSEGNAFVPGLTPVTGDVTITPVWRKIIQVSFDTGGWGEAPPSMEAVHTKPYGYMRQLPDYSGYARTGYTAAGWYLDAAGTGDAVTFDSVVNTNQDHILYIKWEKTGHVVTVEPNGGVWADGTSSVDPREIVSEIGGTVFIPVGSVVRSGYEQDGWTDANGREFIPGTTAVTGDITIMPVWKRLVRISFDIGGWGDAPLSVEAVYTKAYGYKQQLPNYSGYTRTGYTAAGWYLDPAATEAAITSASIVENEQDHVLYLKWEKTGHIVTVDPNGGKWADGADLNGTRDVTAKDGDTILIPGEVIRAGYEQDGWKDTSGNPFVPGETPVDDDITIMPVWRKIHMVTLVPNGGSWTQNGSQGNLEFKIVDGGTFDIPEIERDGYKLLGWKVQGIGAQWQPSERVTGDFVLSANWLQLVTVTFDAQGGRTEDGMLPGPLYVEYGGVYGELPYVEQTGRGFEGWYNSEGKKVTSTVPVLVDGDHTLTARWNYEKVTVQFDWMDKPDTGRSTVRSTTTNYGRRFGSLAPPTPVHPSSTQMNFKGWFSEPSGGEEILDSDLITEDTTVYARWARGRYVILFVVNGGNHLTVTRDNGDYLTEPAVPVSADGKAFTGWRAGERKWNFEYDQVWSDLVLTATFAGDEQDLPGLTLENAQRIELLVNEKWPAKKDNSVSWEDIVRGYLEPRVVSASGEDITGAATFEQRDYSAVNFDVQGDYTVNFTAMVNTPGGAQALSGTTVIALVDRTGPVIELQRQRIEIASGTAPSEGQLLAMAGVSASDNYDSQIAVESAFEGISFGNIDWTRENEYVIRLSAMDSSGNLAERRKVLVVAVRDNPKESGLNSSLNYKDSGDAGGHNMGNSGNGGSVLTVIGNSGVPMGKYMLNTKNRWVYTPEGNVPLGTLPNTGSMITYPIALSALLFGGSLATRRKRKTGRNNKTK